MQQVRPSPSPFHVPPPPSSPSLVAVHCVSQATSPRIPASLLAPTGAEAPEETTQPPKYPCGFWLWRNLATGELKPFLCGSWKCPTCAPRTRALWVKLLELARPQRHVVFTRAPRQRPLTAALADITKAIRRGEAAHKRNGRRAPVAWDYFATAERHKKAGVHLHLLQRGDFVSQPKLSALLGRYGWGTVTWLSAIDPPRTHKALSRYVTKHLLAANHPHQPKVGRRIRYSRGFWSGETTAHLRSLLFPTDPADQWVLDRSPAE